MHLALAPARMASAMTRLTFGDRFVPYSPNSPRRIVTAAADVFENFVTRRSKPAWNVAAQMDVVDERPFCRLLRFREDPARTVPQVLLVAPLSGHYATLLRNTVEGLVLDHDVYVTDWIDASQVPYASGAFDLDAYIGYMVDYLRMLSPDIHVVAVCQPAPAVLAATALLAASGDGAQPRTMTLMGGPVDVEAAPTAPATLAAGRSIEWFRKNVTATVPAWYPGAGRRVYPGFVQLAAFMSMNAEKHVDAQYDWFQALVRGDDETADRRRAFYDEYLSVMDVSAEYYLDTVATIFQQNAVGRGTFTWRGELVVPAAIHATALLTIEGELDDISAPGQTSAAHKLCSGIPADAHEHYLQPGVGHYGIFSGSRWRSEILPRIAKFIHAHASRPNRAIEYPLHVAKEPVVAVGLNEIEPETSDVA